MQVDGEGRGGWDLKDIHIVPPIKTTDLVPHLTKAQGTFISAFPIGFQIADQKTRRRPKTLKAGCHGIRVGNKKPTQKNHPKKLKKTHLKPKMGFFGFSKIFNFSWK